MTSPLYPTFQKSVDNAFDQIIRQQVTPWLFLTAGPPLRIKNFDGKLIAYGGGGVGFEGSPRELFWSRYIEPFLEDMCTSQIGNAVEMAEKRGQDARKLLPELQVLLLAGCRKVYVSMADVDQRLRGKGYPKTIQLRSIEGEVSRMAQFIEARIHAELKMWKPRSSLNHWYEKNPFWVWLIPFLMGIILTLLSLYFSGSFK